MSPNEKVQFTVCVLNGFRILYFCSIKGAVIWTKPYGTDRRLCQDWEACCWNTGTHTDTHYQPFKAMSNSIRSVGHGYEKLVSHRCVFHFKRNLSWITCIQSQGLHHPSLRERKGRKRQVYPPHILNHYWHQSNLARWKCLLDHTVSIICSDRIAHRTSHQIWQNKTIIRRSGEWWAQRIHRGGHIGVMTLNSCTTAQKHSRYPKQLLLPASIWPMWLNECYNW